MSYVDLSAATATSVPSTASQSAGTTFNFNSPYASGSQDRPSATIAAPNTATSAQGGPAQSNVGASSPGQSSLLLWLAIGVVAFIALRNHG